jgi:predicted adenine nucleotide alpha hydrolase (AANH) superfamily ATPase
MKLLLHICCGPCSIVPIDRLRQEGAAVTGFWFNPNIHPYTEYEKRRTAAATHAASVELPMIWRDEYLLEEFLRQAAFHEADRCRRCLRMRLSAAAREAKAGGFDAFTTSLLYSVYQPHELIAETGRAVAGETGVEFLYRDFRSGWREGVDRSRAEDLYRQKYCGCIYSEKERWLGKANADCGLRIAD